MMLMDDRVFYCLIPRKGGGFSFCTGKFKPDCNIVGDETIRRMIKKEHVRRVATVMVRVGQPYNYFSSEGELNSDGWKENLVLAAVFHSYTTNRDVWTILEQRDFNRTLGDIVCDNSDQSIIISDCGQCPDNVWHEEISVVKSEKE